MRALDAPEKERLLAIDNAFFSRVLKTDTGDVNACQRRGANGSQGKRKCCCQYPARGEGNRGQADSSTKFTAKRKPASFCRFTYRLPAPSLLIQCHVSGNSPRRCIYGAEGKSATVRLVPRPANGGSQPVSLLRRSSTSFHAGHTKASCLARSQRCHLRARWYCHRITALSGWGPQSTDRSSGPILAPDSNNAANLAPRSWFDTTIRGTENRSSSVRAR